MLASCYQTEAKTKKVHDALETSHGQQEGGDALYGAQTEIGLGLQSHLLSLKENEITDVSQLIEFSERDLRDILDPKLQHELKQFHVSKLVNAIYDDIGHQNLNEFAFVQTITIQSGCWGYFGWSQ